MSLLKKLFGKKAEKDTESSRSPEVASPEPVNTGVPADISSQKLEAEFTFEASDRVTLQAFPEGQVTFEPGEKFPGILSVWHDRDCEIEQWLYNSSDGVDAFNGAAATLRVSAIFQVHEAKYRYNGFIHCPDLHFQAGEQVIENSQFEWE